MTCPKCKAPAPTCVCDYITSLRPGGHQHHLMPAVTAAMASGVHPDRCPCPACVVQRDQRWLAGGCSVTIPVDPTREAAWPRSSSSAVAEIP